jgi:threonine aldolase
MLEAMATAPLGDDVYGEDPTVTRLEAMVAELAGKEAGVFVPSGTMGNLIAVLSHCGRGDEMILGDQSHIHFYEQGGTAALGGVHPRTLRNRADGTLDLAEVEAAIRGDNEHFPVTRLLCLETTHNRCGGVCCRWTTWTRRASWPTATACRCTWTGRGCGTRRCSWGSRQRDCCRGRTAPASA